MSWYCHVAMLSGAISVLLCVAFLELIQKRLSPNEHHHVGARLNFEWSVYGVHYSCSEVSLFIALANIINSKTVILVL